MTEEQLISKFENQLSEMRNEDYKAFVKALARGEGYDLSDDQFASWYGSDFALLDESLTSEEA